MSLQRIWSNGVRKYRRSFARPCAIGQTIREIAKGANTSGKTETG